MKMISLVERRPDLSVAAFRAYYENRHVPLAQQHFPFEGYVRNHVTARGAGFANFDCIAECWIDMARLRDILEGPLGDVFAEDQGRFMRGPARTAGALASRTFPGRLHLATHKHMVLLRAPDADAAWNHCLHWARIQAARPGALARIALDRLDPQAAPQFGADILISYWNDGGDALEAPETAGGELVAYCPVSVCR